MVASRLAVSAFAVLALAACGGDDAAQNSETPIDDVRTVTNYEGEVVTVPADHPDDYSEGQAAPPLTSEPKPDEVGQAIFDWMHSRATTEPWMRTLVGVRVETDTASIAFDPFKGAGDGFDDINSLPADALCRAVLAESFPGVEHVKIVVLNEGTRAECP